MNKTILYLLGGVLVIGVGVVVIKTVTNPKTTSTQTSQNNISQEKKKEEKPKDSQSGIVPLPLDTDILNSFFSLMEQGRASDAVSMMSVRNTSDDSTKQTWGVLFNAMKSIKLKSTEPIMQNDWTDSRHEYKVVLDIVMDPFSADAPIPYYGYETGENIRFITLVKENKLWKIDEIATGP